MTKSASRNTALWAALLILVAGCTYFYAKWGYPVEDAAMIFRYSENIAAGHGVVYLPGGERVDGASDLVLTFALAGLVRLGVPVEIGAALMNGAALGVIVLLIFLSWRRHDRDRLWAPLVAIAVFLATTPFLFLGASGFGTLVFGAVVATTAYMTLSTERDASVTWLILLGFTVAFAGMNRIEGLALAGCTVLAQAVAQKSLRLVAVPAATAIMIALVWFGWKWSYFGYPLPNPLYKKGGLYPRSALFAVRSVIEYTLPWLPVLVAGVYLERTRRRALSYLALIILPWTAIWILLSNEMNLLARFQFPIAPVIALLCGPLAVALGPALVQSLRSPAMPGHPGRRVAVLAAAIVAVVAPTYLTAGRQWEKLSAIRTLPAIQGIADAVRRASDGSDLLATTEAGMIAWRSGLPVVDLWGLNDKRIAHHGLLSPSEIAELDPQIIFTHLMSPKVLELPADKAKEGSWDRMNINIFCFAERNQFAPAAIWTGTDGNDWKAILAKAGTPLMERLTKELAGVAWRGQLPTVDVTIPHVRDCQH